MKNTIVKLLVFSTMLLYFPAALCQSDPLAHLVIEDEWMTGTVTACFDVGTENESFEAIRVDCPEPPEAYPQEILTVVNRYVSKKEMQQALQAAGQSIDGTFVNPRGSASYTGNWNKPASASISKEAAAAQATEIGLKYFEALGVEVDPIPTYIDRPYDYDAYMEQQIRSYEHRLSDTSTFIDNAKSQWKRRSKYHPKQSEYTSVYFSLMLDGMRLHQSPSYPAGYHDEPDAWIGYDASAHVIVSDSGVLVEATCALLEVISKRPLEGDPVYESFLPHYMTHIGSSVPADNWQTALKYTLTDGSSNGQLGRSSEDSPFQNKYMDAPITVYGSKPVITAIYPVLHTISEYEWAPFWSIETAREYSDGWRE